MVEPSRGRWSAPFVAMFEALGMGPRWARGRRDARAGHVRSLTVSSSLVVAQVRGPEEPRAHRARIAVRAFGAAEWAAILDDLAGQARYAAELLAGRLPEGTEAVVAAAGLHLLPLSITEVAMDCSCDEWPTPCRHVAAACHALADAFDTDPFAVLAWRGRTRDELLEELRQRRGVVEAPPPSAAAGLDVASFWDDPGTPAAPSPPAPTHRPDLLLDLVPPPDLAAGGTPVVELLRRAYRAFAADATD